jgi:bifunctional non-homologous end joining protein LigD
MCLLHTVTLGFKAGDYYIRYVLRKIPFIKPMAPTLAQIPPMGEDWLHEVKFDGWRAQLHIDQNEATLYSKSGADITKRFRSLRTALCEIPCRQAIIDCELVACGSDGMPCFRTLMTQGNEAPLALWAFDLLQLDGVRLTPIGLEDRREYLAELIAAADSERIQFSGAFDDPIELLKTCEKMDLEGIVSKRRGSSYHSGVTRDWLKIKTAAWRAANTKRFELLKKRA